MKIVELSPASHQYRVDGQDSRRRRTHAVRDGIRRRSAGTVEVVNEWPDVDTAVRALARSGPAIPAIEAVGYDAFSDVLREVVTPLDDPHTGVRISSELGWVTARPA